MDQSAVRFVGESRANLIRSTPESSHKQGYPALIVPGGDITAIVKRGKSRASWAAVRLYRELTRIAVQRPKVGFRHERTHAVQQTALIYRRTGNLREPSSWRELRAATCSLDHLIGAGKYRCRHSEAERLSGLEVEHSFVFGRRLHR
jgi:hypothetical protein